MDTSNPSEQAVLPTETSVEPSTPPKAVRRLRKKHYEKINDEIRKKIIFRVTVLGEKLKTVWEKLQINVSSAKNVLAIYKKEGRIEKKKYRVKRRKTGENQETLYAPVPVNGSKMGMVPSSTNLNLYTQGFGATPQGLTQPMQSLNELSLSLLVQNYCMCPVVQQPKPLPMPDMDECIKSVNQMMAMYGKAFPYSTL